MDALAWEMIDFDEVKSYVDENGVSGMEAFLKKKLEMWKDVVINIGITGDSGTGKSSFINTIRELPDDDELAAEVGVTESTIEPAPFPHPSNSKIKFWDLPGIGTPKYPDLETYSEEVKLEKYDTFLIFTAGRFTENDLELAKKIRLVNKKFFFIRTKIDNNVRDESRKKSFNEESMLDKIRGDCSENLVGLVEDIGDIFLISNHHPFKWDFSRLTEAILDVLPMLQRASLTLSLGILSYFPDIFQRKIQLLKSRIWLVALASCATSIVLLPGLFNAVDLTLIMSAIAFFRFQLNLPEEGSARFQMLNAELQEKVRKYCLTTAAQMAGFLPAYSTAAHIQEATRFISVVGLDIAGTVSFTSTYLFLNHLLKMMEETAMEVIDEIAARPVKD